MTIKERVLRALQVKGEMAVRELVDELDVTKQSVHIALNSLIDEGAVVKLGKVPKTVYRLQSGEKISKTETGLSVDLMEYLDSNFFLITEIGELKEGVSGFEIWCAERKLPLAKTADEYMRTKEKYNHYFNSLGIIDGTEKLINTKEFDQIFLDDIFYLDFYAIERFGKTRLGTLLHFAKQGQNKFLMKKMVSEIRQKVDQFIKASSFNAVGFVPPTIRREVQIMKYLERNLPVNLPKLSLQKISGIIPVPQKSLSKIEQRIKNADNTFAVIGTGNYDHVLLIDDAVGSGSTLNQIAAKLKQKGIARKVSGLAVVGSFKGFDVITDV